MEIKAVLYFSALHESFQEDRVYIHNNISIKWENMTRKFLKATILCLYIEISAV